MNTDKVRIEMNTLHERRYIVDEPDIPCISNSQKFSELILCDRVMTNEEPLKQFHSDKRVRQLEGD